MDKRIKLIDLYYRFKSPSYVMKHSHMIKENGRNICSIKTEMAVPLLGKITFGSIYIESALEAVPVMFLNHEQVNLLLEKGVRLSVSKKKYSSSDVEVYVCFPSRHEIERIDSL